MRTISIKIASLVALIAAACGTSGPNVDDLNDRDMPSGGTGSSGGTGGTGVTSGGTGAVATAGTGAVATGGTGAVATAGTGAVATGGTGAVTTGGTGAVATGGTGGVATAGTGTGGADAVGGTAGAEPVGGSGGTGMETGGSGGMTGGTGGSGGTEPIDAYSPREGPFKMLIYSRVAPGGFTHGSIPAGIQMLQQIATEQGFEATATEENRDITATGLAQYEIVFFMNPTNDIFNPTEEAAFEDWITTKNGAFGGVHSATDTEEGWAFYKELTGQYYNGHGNANTPGGIQFDSAMLAHPALVDLPNPWQRNEEWYLFNNHQQWSTKPGFQMLGRKQSDNQPIMWIREWGNFRSFYTAIGHDSVVFQDADVKKHVTGGIMWAVRRDHLIR